MGPAPAVGRRPGHNGREVAVQVIVHRGDGDEPPPRVARPMTVRPDQRFADVPRSSGCQCVWSVDAQIVVDVVPSMSPMATEVSPEVTSVLTLPSGSSVASRCHSRPAHVSDRGGGAVVKATACGWGRWAGGAVDPGRADAGLVAAEGLAAGPTADRARGCRLAGVTPRLGQGERDPDHDEDDGHSHQLVGTPPGGGGCAIERTAVSHRRSGPGGSDPCTRPQTLSIGRPSA